MDNPDWVVLIPQSYLVKGRILPVFNNHQRELSLIPGFILYSHKHLIVDHVQSYFLHYKKSQCSTCSFAKDTSELTYSLLIFPFPYWKERCHCSIFAVPQLKCVKLGVLDQCLWPMEFVCVTTQSNSSKRSWNPELYLTTLSLNVMWSSQIYYLGYENLRRTKAQYHALLSLVASLQIHF